MSREDAYWVPATYVEVMFDPEDIVFGKVIQYGKIFHIRVKGVEIQRGHVVFLIHQGGQISGEMMYLQGKSWETMARVFNLNIETGEPTPALWATSFSAIAIGTFFQTQGSDLVHLKISDNDDDQHGPNNTYSMDDFPGNEFFGAHPTFFFPEQRVKPYTVQIKRPRVPDPLEV